jgi:hypothetical protein
MCSSNDFSIKYEHTPHWPVALGNGTFCFFNSLAHELLVGCHRYLLYAALLTLLRILETDPDKANVVFEALELNQDGQDKIKLHVTPEFIELFKDQPIIVLKALEKHSPLLQAVHGKISQQLQGQPPRKAINDFLENFLQKEVYSQELKSKTEEVAEALMILIEKEENVSDNLEKLKKLLYLIEGLFDTTSYNFGVIAYRIGIFLEKINLENYFDNVEDEGS